MLFRDKLSEILGENNIDKYHTGACRSSLPHGNASADDAERACDESRQFSVAYEHLQYPCACRCLCDDPCDEPRHSYEHELVSELQLACE